MIYIDEPFATVEWNRDLRCVEVEFRGSVQPDQCQRVLEDALELMITMEGRCWIADMRQCTALDGEAQRWVRMAWHAKATSAGLERMAIVVPANDNDGTPTNPLFGDAEERAPALTFRDRQQAVDWLKAPWN